jgi:cytochrome c peroxidase
MKHGTLVKLSIASIVVVTAVIVLVTRIVSTQKGLSQIKKEDGVYFPYPPAVIPADLEKEIKRVQGEVDQIEKKALSQWKALPINSSTRMQQVQILGKLLLFDKNLSVNRNQACSFCHMPSTGFTGPISSLNATTVAYPGSVHFRFGHRKPQSYTYAPYTFPLQYNQTQQAFFGGNFFDLRATGYKIQSAAAEQAQDPPLDTQEMGTSDFACVVYRISQSLYRPLFETVWGKQAFAIRWPANVEKVCSIPGPPPATDPFPVHLSEVDRGFASVTYDQFQMAVAAYEAGPEVSAFTSKFDYFLAGVVKLTPEEQRGYDLFRGKGNCNSCHLDGRSTALKANQTDTGTAASTAPLFTCFGAANLGLPRNLANPYYYENTPDRFGFTPNPLGLKFIDFGLGGVLRGPTNCFPPGSSCNPNSSWTQFADSSDGKMKTVTVRNVDMRPTPDFVKAYMHNGYLKSLKEVVHFYNTRDKFAYPMKSGDCPKGTTEKVDCWPMPEVPKNVDKTIGNLGLTDEEENLIVLFMKTLTDGYTPPSGAVQRIVRADLGQENQRRRMGANP